MEVSVTSHFPPNSTRSPPFIGAHDRYLPESNKAVISHETLNDSFCYGSILIVIVFDPGSWGGIEVKGGGNQGIEKIRALRFDLL